MVAVNVVVLAGRIAAEPVRRVMPSGTEVTELRVSVPEQGKRLLPLPVAVWHDAVPVAAVQGLGKDDQVLVHGQSGVRGQAAGRRHPPDAPVVEHPQGVGIAGVNTRPQRGYAVFQQGAAHAAADE
ncbi:MAG: single-stranded DNA-binding protein [Longimicrobiales bacterium]|nr:single-stranded DNA-binding protein [Longimicrobiales bacterium]